MRQIKNFISDFNVLLGNTFFYCQARFSQIIRDEIAALIRRRTLCFPIISGAVDPDNTFNKEAEQYKKLLQFAQKRGNSIANYSASITLESIPNFAKKIIDYHYKEIESYLGKKFLYERPQVWRNFHLPDELTTYDVFSNVWHQDSHDGFRVIKLFVQLNLVTETDGPLRFLDRESTCRYWHELRHRWDFEKISRVPVFNEEQYFTGDAGAYLIFDTSRMMHRAGNPKNFRDIFQISFFPEWRKSCDRKVFEK